LVVCRSKLDTVCLYSIVFAFRIIVNPEFSELRTLLTLRRVKNVLGGWLWAYASGLTLVGEVVIRTIYG
jgi:hypothetical protein